MAVKTSSYLSSRAIIGRFFLMIEQAVFMSWAERLAHTNFETEQSSEEYVLASMTPQMRRWVGGRDAKRILAEALTVANEKYEVTLRDKVDNFKFDRTGQLNQRLADMVKRTKTHWNKLCTDALVLGTSTLTYDGQYFFDTDHSFGSSGTQKNLLTSSEVSALNVTTAAAPTNAEMADCINGVINYMFGWLDDVGEPINEEAQNFIVMVPINMAAAARAAASKALLATGSTAVDNPLLGTGFNITIAPNPRLTATTAFYVFREDGSLKPFILQQRGPLRETAKAEGSDFEHDNDEWEFGFSADRAAALFGWQSAAKATLS